MGLSFEKQSLNKKPLGHSEHSLICAACEKTKSDKKNRGGKVFHEIEIKSKEIEADTSRWTISSLDISQPFVSIALRCNPPVVKPEFYVLFHKQSLRTCKVVLEYQPKSSSVGVCFSSPRCCLATDGKKLQVLTVKIIHIFLQHLQQLLEVLTKYCFSTQIVGGYQWLCIFSGWNILRFFHTKMSRLRFSGIKRNHP